VQINTHKTAIGDARGVVSPIRVDLPKNTQDDSQHGKRPHSNPESPTESPTRKRKKNQEVTDGGCTEMIEKNQDDTRRSHAALNRLMGSGTDGTDVGQRWDNGVTHGTDGTEVGRGIISLALNEKPLALFDV